MATIDTNTLISVAIAFVIILTVLMAGMYTVNILNQTLKVNIGFSPTIVLSLIGVALIIAVIVAVIYTIAKLRQTTATA